MVKFAFHLKRLFPELGIPSREQSAPPLKRRNVGLGSDQKPFDSVFRDFFKEQGLPPYPDIIYLSDSEEEVAAEEEEDPSIFSADCPDGLSGDDAAAGCFSLPRAETGFSSTTPLRGAEESSQQNCSSRPSLPDPSLCGEERVRLSIMEHVGHSSERLWAFFDEFDREIQNQRIVAEGNANNNPIHAAENHRAFPLGCGPHAPLFPVDDEDECLMEVVEDNFS